MQLMGCTPCQIVNDMTIEEADTRHNEIKRASLIGSIDWRLLGDTNPLRGFVQFKGRPENANSKKTRCWFHTSQLFQARAREPLGCCGAQERPRLKAESGNFFGVLLPMGDLIWQILGNHEFPA